MDDDDVVVVLVVLRLANYKQQKNEVVKTGGERKILYSCQRMNIEKEWENIKGQNEHG